MGSYLNAGNFSFRRSLRSQIYVDKSELIAKTNEALCTEQKYICVSRPRRFGKSMAANMLAYEALKIYIQMDMDGLKDSVVRMLAGESVPINIGTFSNDMTTFATRDDVLTLLVHLGYLTYNVTDGTVSIPNKEVSREYINAISTMDWHGVAEAVEDSRRLLEALWVLDEEAVAAGIEKAHDELSILQYNDENSLSCAINLAFYFAREYYTIVREMPAGKGFADICMIPRKEHLDKPAVVIELKWDKSAVGALEQIKEKNYKEELIEAGISENNIKAYGFAFEGKNVLILD